MKKIYNTRELRRPLGKLKAGLNYIHAIENYNETAYKYQKGYIGRKEYDDTCTLMNAYKNEALRYI